MASGCHARQPHRGCACTLFGPRLHTRPRESSACTPATRPTRPTRPLRAPAAPLPHLHPRLDLPSASRSARSGSCTTQVPQRGPMRLTTPPRRWAAAAFGRPWPGRHLRPRPHPHRSRSPRTAGSSSPTRRQRRSCSRRSSSRSKSRAMLTRTSRGIRTVRPGPPVLIPGHPHQRHRAACSRGAKHGTYAVGVPASGMPYVPRTVWCTTGGEPLP